MVREQSRLKIRLTVWHVSGAAGTNPADTYSAPWLVKEALTALLATEGVTLRRFGLPWGLSIVAVATRH